ncbi:MULTISPECIES: GntR family transcriptional regulator [unclassified Streptomyces]|uniref:FadR/GntR family transcriptional regulator n=1 Tax=unclassified Streptomyces TaxID=2593676 RepID=UPI0006F4365F|nr:MULTISPECIES: GntR family transcriptional regulator [unclassified Streptomyces]KQX46201.1 GntR family transcriptional regulator [Streptomyces sp. Root1304]KRA80986.1 GntR family transcriptional regulator [Streptomyces sp. Root66D1]
MRPDGRPDDGGAAGRGAARRAVFAPVDTRARVDTVVRRIGDAIELGLLADGEQLPGETELAGQLGVSTVTLREALMALRQQGLVTTRRGRGGGSFVTLPDDPPQERLRARLADWSTEELRDLGDHWAAVSGAAALLAARRTQPGDLRPLARTAEELATAEDPASRSRLYGRFHVELAAAAQSARLTREEIALQTDLGALLCLVLDDPGHLANVSDRHRAVISAVQDEADERARALAETCVRESVGRLITLRLAAPGRAPEPRSEEDTHGQEHRARGPRGGRR